MIHHLKGQLIEKNPTYLVIACNGVGYMVNISLHTFSLIPDSENISVYTHLHVKEDSHTLYGFYQKSERDIFRLLISVSGVGTSTARTMLSSLEPNQVKEAIANGDVPTIQSVKGIGAKTAQRVILDLKDKILKVYGEDEVFVPQDNTIKEEALSALETLGFARKQATRVVDKIMKDSTSPTVESIIKMALKNL
ncbi:Holliday junction branch migration protein RuvA [Salegentibacter mishustinae]|jgi:Holliday junction DNA helicase RuvA|uniref:Holliday junction branch migration complex subunit RuvA n=1 Tax=Salegentibacter mishustinae TaxID=270918 RepID=A0A0Q9ZDF2_9FLAO|nr:Holliday junction branch migration protein RuvA [Salegentibacter mishustinae]KRG27530.1 ATP-dependent DNA helicase RuvA [Salegentibacter mishustinae]MDX1426357.1 Holliday junction branch migration protein RuvA [Salegentibacter mishustinae]PNW20414.1 ATP-dependent DNA helicase RuvA [Salegentibacter mishustinae]PZX63207.1 Holliday junction DNA helicase subunit RuvA [Salegentibacter mishustinae]UBZ07798.1 Holliday junction branch migration protein RuvA [Salegentibacter mishustinae]|tara:strand:+ start:155 stop:736 length:582 start_codon:yes stop_codon:yes gene_type:complete